MVKANSNMALAGPHLVKAAVGEDISAEDMGGSKIHCKISGVADLEVQPVGVGPKASREERL